MLVVLLIAAAAILCGVVAVAMGRGGELALPPADVRPLDADIVSAADVAMLRPPAALWGYDMRATDQALNMVARTVTERDVEIAILRHQIAELQAAAKEPGSPARPPARPSRAGASEALPQPFQRGIGGPRSPADAQPWSAWRRAAPAPAPAPTPLPEPGEQRERETG